MQTKKLQIQKAYSLLEKICKVDDIIENIQNLIEIRKLNDRDSRVQYYKDGELEGKKRILLKDRSGLRNEYDEVVKELGFFNPINKDREKLPKINPKKVKKINEGT